MNHGKIGVLKFKASINWVWPCSKWWVKNALWFTTDTWWTFSSSQFWRWTAQITIDSWRKGLWGIGVTLCLIPFDRRIEHPNLLKSQHDFFCLVVSIIFHTYCQLFNHRNWTFDDFLPHDFPIFNGASSTTRSFMPWAPLMRRCQKSGLMILWTSPLNGGFNRNVNYKWAFFSLWFPKGIGHPWWSFNLWTQFQSIMMWTHWNPPWILRPQQLHHSPTGRCCPALMYLSGLQAIDLTRGDFIWVYGNFMWVFPSDSPGMAMV